MSVHLDTVGDDTASPRVVGPTRDVVGRSALLTETELRLRIAELEARVGMLETSLEDVQTALEDVQTARSAEAHAHAVAMGEARATVRALAWWVAR